jgi:glycosyltransferase involved in cell wall biosynthesis
MIIRPAENSHGEQLPAIALVTACLNQAKWLETAINSVLNQEYGNLQYVVLDGDSGDGCVELARKFSDRLHHVDVKPDAGQYDALNKGFALTDAPIMGWLNGDDIHFPWTLSLVGKIFATFPEVRWLTTSFPVVIDADGTPCDCREARAYSRQGILRGETLPASNAFVLGGMQQESTFWRRDLWEEAGGRLEAALDYAADFDLWMRFANLADVYCVNSPLAAFRRHGEQKSVKDMNRYVSQATSSFRRHGKNASNRNLRKLSRNVLPECLKPIAAKLGCLYTAKLIRKTKQTGEWTIQDIYA